LHNDVGSISIIVSPTFTPHVQYRYFDPLRMGVVGAVRLSFLAYEMLVIGAYWMPKPTSADSQMRNSLWYWLERTLAASRLHITPLQYVQQSIDDMLLLAHANSWRVIFSADFNGGYRSSEGVYKDIKPWADERHLNNLPFVYHSERSERLPTHNNACIDHVLSWLPGYKYRPFQLSKADLSLIETISDHQPLIVDFCGPPLHRAAPYLPPHTRHVDLDLANPYMVCDFQHSMSSSRAPGPVSSFDSPHMHADYIDALCDFAVHSVEQLKNPIPKKHRVFQGWSPQYMLDCYYLSFLYKLRSLLKHQDHNYLSPSNRPIQIERLV
jgi:hypothetical protein